MTTEQGRPGATDARAYDRGRPGYPREAADWLVGGAARTVLELGAGTGQLTRQLFAAGHDVHATDPDEAMLRVLGEHLPSVRTGGFPAEEISLPDRSVDVVVCAASFGLLEPERALPAIARVLRPGGHLAVVWHERDERIPWVRRLGRLLDGPTPELTSPQETLVHSPLFSFVEERTFKSWQGIDRESVRDVVLSRAHVAALPPEQREERVEEVLDLYAEYGRGMDGMQLPHLVRCLRTQVVHQPGLFGEAAEPADGGGRDADREESEAPDRAVDIQDTSNTGNAGDTGDDGAGRRARSQERFRSDGTDTDMLLIDFR